MPTPNALPSWKICLVLVFLAAAVRLPQLDRESLWGDEIVHARAARLATASEVVDNVQIPHSVGYPLALHFWMQMDPGDHWVRFLSVLCGVVSVGLIYHLGVRWFGPIEGCFAALFLALSSSHVRFSREAAPYAPQTAVLLAAVLCWWTALRSDRWIAWLGFAVLGALSHYLHPLASTTILGLYCLALLIRPWGISQRGGSSLVEPRSFSLVRFFVSGGLFLALIAYQVYENMDKAARYAGTSTVPLSFHRYLEEVHRLLGGNWVSWLPYVLATAALVGLIRVLIATPWLGAALAGWAAGTFAIWAAFKAVQSHFFDYHYFISHLPAFSLMIAAGFGSLLTAIPKAASGRVWRGVGTGIVVLSISGLLAQAAWLEFRRSWPEYREAGRFLENRLEPEDRYFIREESYLDFMVEYYCPDRLDQAVGIEFFLRPEAREQLESLSGRLYVIGRGVREATDEVRVRPFKGVHAAWLEPQRYDQESLKVLLEGEGAKATGLYRANNLLERARSLYHAKAYVEAASSIIEAASLAPHLFAVVRLKGEILLDAGRPAEAAPAFRAASELVPAKEKWWMRACEAKALNQLKQYDAAIALLTAALEDPETSPANLYRMIGENYFAKEDYEKAEESFRKSLEGKPGQQSVLIRIADCLMLRSLPEEAIRVYEEALAVTGPEQENAERKLDAARKAASKE